MWHWILDFVLLGLLFLFLLDGLTLLWVRRCYNIFYHLMVKTNGHLIFIDIDDFARFNNEYGHQMGDRVLRQVGRIIMEKSHFRGFRYGGDELAVLLPWTSEKKALKLAEKIRLAVEALKIGDLGVTITCVVNRYEETASKVLRQYKNDKNNRTGH